MDDPAAQAAQGDAAAVEAIRQQLGQLGTALALWNTRDDSRPCPEARRAASAAVDAIDAMLRELHAVRARLITEIRQSDDARAAALDELLARLHPGAS
jgi:hypothetical protein